MPSFETRGPITAAIDVVVGDVRITAGDRAATVVDVRPSDPANEDDATVAQRTRVEYGDARLLVKSPKLPAWRPGRTGGSIDVTIELPAGSRVEASGQLTDFRSDGPLADCRIRTGIGAIRVDSAVASVLKTGIGDIGLDHGTGHAEITAASGDIRVRKLDTSGVIKSSNGDTWVGAAGGELRVNAANGSIAVDLAEAGVVAKSANGDVRVGEAVRDTVVLETRLGDLEVGIREGTAAWLDARAKAGKVHSTLDAAEAPDPDAETVEVRARTTAGNVLVRRP